MKSSSPSCIWSCFSHSPGDINSEHAGSALSFQTRGHHAASSSQPQTLCRMSEGDVTVLPFNPAALDLSRQESRTLTRLYSMNGGYHLRILPDGTVSGGRQENDPNEVLGLKAVSVGVVVIKGELTGRYLAMNKKGRLYGSQALNDECYFLEKYEENNYNTYRSQKYNWYVALKRNGQPKAGPDTHQGQKAVFFLPRPAESM
ncbi:putative fibroblast growth factor 1 isoform X1 [Labrus bergylta]|uniref:putative fibroblast growth factor 1 isoform X1 n=2 Tax=Labrus bergylta TaxID=56723 RepID=UPI00331428AF